VPEPASKRSTRRIWGWTAPRPRLFGRTPELHSTYIGIKWTEPSGIRISDGHLVMATPSSGMGTEKGKQTRSRSVSPLSTATMARYLGHGTS